MTIRHNQTPQGGLPGEPPPLPPSVPLVEKWCREDPNNNYFMSWVPVPSDQWPADMISRTVYDMARQNPGQTFPFRGDDDGRYRVTFSVGPLAPSPATLLCGLIEYPAPPLPDPVAANEPAEALATTIEESLSAAYLTTSKGPREYAYEAQERLFPVRHPAEACLPPMLPEICITVRDSLCGHSDMMPREQLQEIRAMLQARYDTWDTTAGGKHADMTLSLDTTIRSMVLITVAMIDAELALRIESGVSH